MYFQLQSHLIKYSTLINVVIRTIPSDLAEHVPIIQKILIELMKSPLAAPIVVPLYINLKNCVFEDDLKHLGELWMHLSLFKRTLLQYRHLIIVDASLSSDFIYSSPCEVATTSLNADGSIWMSFHIMAEKFSFRIFLDLRFDWSFPSASFFLTVDAIDK